MTNKKAKDYYSAIENSYQEDSKRLSERGLRSELESQIESSYGESTTKNDLSTLVSSKDTSGAEFGGTGQSKPTLKEHKKKNKQKK